MRGLSDPGPVRGWWWRSSQSQRIAVAGVGAVVGVAALVAMVVDVPTSAPSVTFPVAVPVLGGTSAATTTTVPPSPTSSAPVSNGPSEVDTIVPVPTTSTTPSGTTSSVVPPTTTDPTTTTTTETPPPTTTTEVQRDVKVGQPCSPPGAAGITPQGVLVVCVTGPHGESKWRKL